MFVKTQRTITQTSLQTSSSLLIPRWSVLTCVWTVHHYKLQHCVRVRRPSTPQCVMSMCRTVFPVNKPTSQYETCLSGSTCDLDTSGCLNPVMISCSWSWRILFIARRMNCWVDGPSSDCCQSRAVIRCKTFYISCQTFHSQWPSVSARCRFVAIRNPTTSCSLRLTGNTLMAKAECVSHWGEDKTAVTSHWEFLVN